MCTGTELSAEATPPSRSSGLRPACHPSVCACRKPREAKGKTPAGAMPVDLDKLKMEDLIAQFAGELDILPGAALKL